MDSVAPVTTTVTGVTSMHRSMTRSILIALHAVLGVAAVVAGQAFVREPSGAALGMSADWLKRSPFRSFRIPGLFLMLVIGGTNLLSAAVLWRRDHRSELVSLATGLLLVVWVAIQTAIIGFRHWSQGIWWVTFSILTVLAARLVRRRTG
jgi:hypothetical protein